MTLPDPPILVITDRSQCADSLETRAAALFAGGCRWLSLREKDLSAADRLALLARLAAIGRAFGATVGVHGDLAAAAEYGTALHLHAQTPSPNCHAMPVFYHSSEAPPPLRGRSARRAGWGGWSRLLADRGPAAPYPPPGNAARCHPPPQGGRRSALVGQSCHNAAELAAADAAQVDYVTLSPVFASASKPGYEATIDKAELAALVARTRAPVLALGGVGTGTIGDLAGIGFRGVAIMGEAMRTLSPVTWFAEVTRQWAIVDR